MVYKDIIAQLMRVRFAITLDNSKFFQDVYVKKTHPTSKSNSSNALHIPRFNIHTKEVRKQIQKLKLSWSSRPDNIPSAVLKKTLCAFMLSVELSI